MTNIVVLRRLSKGWAVVHQPPPDHLECLAMALHAETAARFVHTGWDYLAFGLCGGLHFHEVKRLAQVETGDVISVGPRPCGCPTRWIVGEVAGPVPCRRMMNTIIGWRAAVKEAGCDLEAAALPKDTGTGVPAAPTRQPGGPQECET